MKLNCIRKNCSTGIETTEVHVATVKRAKFDNQLWLYLSPGVTGYESAPVEGLLEDRYKQWYACAGTPNRYDELLVPEAELERLKDILRLIPL